MAPATGLACVCVGWIVAWLGHAPCQGVLCNSLHSSFSSSAVSSFIVV